ncbi:MAG: TlyA family RNA methyltransferase [Oscillospiraceae bacterium]
MKGTRLDVLLVSNGLCESRERARALIMAGLVFVSGERADKAGATFAEDAVIDIKGSDCPFVSRGGKKLARAVDEFSLSLEGLVCADIGASTGGFTDCMLQNGALRVYSVDVGYGQLAWKLREDSRVVCLERTNARNLSREQIPELLDFASADVSFISLSLILPALAPLLKNGGRCTLLIKPQFEAGKEKVGKKGVVRDPTVHVEVIERVFGFLEDNGLSVLGLTHSPIKGPQGNIEYLVCAQKSAQPNVDIDIKAAVVAAHKMLD